MKQTVPITSLASDHPPPADKSIRGIVTLSWPYSSSTRQCALLLADPDFRLRKCRGQVRVRFTGASAEAVAKSHVGIGDEVVLALDGGSWEEDTEATRAPGKSVDGELFFGRKLELNIVGNDRHIEVRVDTAVSPPLGSPAKHVELATPLPKAVGKLRSSLDGTVETLPSYTYTSPAFAKRLRLSGDYFLDSAYNPFDEVGLQLHQEESRPRASFGSKVKWRLAEKTPSPTNDAFDAIPKTSPHRETVKDVAVEQEDGTNMLPPPLPRLEVQTSSPRRQKTPDKEENHGPSTPKLRPVPSPTLPLPSPFPTEVMQQPFGQANLISTVPGTGVTSINHEDESQDGDVQTADGSIDYSDEATVAVKPVGLEASESMISESADIVYEDEVDEEIEPEGFEPPDEVESEEDQHSLPSSEKGDAVRALEEIGETEEGEVELPDLHNDHVLTARPRTPTKESAAAPLFSDFGLDGTTSAVASVQVTPQSSDKDKIMAKTYQSLFGFAELSDTASETQLPLEGVRKSASPMPEEEISKMAEARLEDVGNRSEHKEEDRPSSPLSEPPAEIKEANLFEIVPAVSSQQEEAQLPESPTSKGVLSEMGRARLEVAGIQPQEQRESSPLSEPPAEAEELVAVEKTAPSEPPPSSLARPSQVEIIDIGSSSEEESEDEEEDESLTPKATDTTAAHPRFVSPEIQDSLEDSETEDLLHQKYHITNQTQKAAELLVSEGVSTSQKDSGQDLEKSQSAVEVQESTFVDGLKPQQERLEIDTAPPKSTAPTSVIDLLSSSPVEEPDRSEAKGQDEFIEQSPGVDETSVLISEEELDKGETGDPEEFIEQSPRFHERALVIPDKDTDKSETVEPAMFIPDEPDTISRIDVGQQTEVKSLSPEIEVVDEHMSPPVPDQDVHLQPQTVQGPSYPSLPITPSNSQSLQEMPSPDAPEPVIPESIYSVLPPTPQLTQPESFGYPQLPVDSQASTSQQTQPDVTAHSSERAEEELAASQPGDVEPAPEEPALGLAKDKITSKSERKTPSRKSLTSRFSNVPEVISAWFSPRRSNGVMVEDSEQKLEAALAKPEVQELNGSAPALTNGHDLAVSEFSLSEKLHKNGFSTALSYFTPLSRLDELMNPSSQQTYGTNSLDIFAVVTDSTKAAERAKAGPRDYFTIFRVCDASLLAQASIRVEVFRPWKATLPVADVGDIVLLRDFVIKSRKRQAYLLSTDASAWCVWRYSDVSTASKDSNKPIWARKAGVTAGDVVREEVKGPPVELGDEEKEHARHLRLWWERIQSPKQDHEVNDTDANAGMNGNVSHPLAAKL